MNDKFCGNCGKPVDMDGKCPFCDKSVISDSFCGNCGKRLTSNGICPVCSANPQIDTFCGNCGKPLLKNGTCTECNNSKNYTKPTKQQVSFIKPEKQISKDTKQPKREKLPKQPKERKPVSKKTKVLSVMLALTILFTGIGGYFAMSYQAKAVVNDLTIAATQSENNTEQQAEQTVQAQTAQFSPNVTVFTDSEADAVNSGIKRIDFKKSYLSMEITNSTAFSNLDTGDIFYLEGSEDTPLGEPFVGKITSVSKGSSTTSYTIETPMVDEVFDVLKIDYEKIMDASEIDTIKTVEGVSVEYTDDISTEFKEISTTTSTSPVASNLTYTTSSAPSPTPLSDDKDLILDIKIDLLKLLNIKEEAKAKHEEKNEKECKETKVFVTDTGEKYHKNECQYLHSSKNETTLYAAIMDGYTPCLICKPPVNAETLKKEETDEKTQETTTKEKGPFKADPSLNIVGKIGVEDLAFDVLFDWDLLNGKGLNKLQVNANGNFVAALGLESELSLKLEGKDTETNTLLGFAKFQGLQNKLLPIAYIGYNGASITASIVKGSEVKNITGGVPFSVGILFYTDITGKLSVKATAGFEYNYRFDCTYTAVSDGKWVNKFESTGIPSLESHIDVEVAGDLNVDLLGASVMLYVFNLNVAELAIAKIGFEAEGSLKVSTQKKRAKVDGNWVTTAKNEFKAEVYARAFLKILEFNLKLKTKINFWIIIDISSTLDYNWLYKDYTLAEWGTKKSTKFDNSSMSYTAVTAKDFNSIYYKDTNGALVKEENGYKTILFDEDFFSICGIDSSYIYVLIPNENKYSLTRIAKDGSTTKELANDVANMLMMDDLYFYFVSTFDSNVIIKMDRESHKQSEFATFDKAVRFMQMQEDYYYYVVAEDTDSLAAIFGPTSYCYLLNGTGEIIDSYGTDPSVKQMFITDMGDYRQAARMVSNGYLRSTASEIHWMSGSSKDNTVLTECVSGWNPLDAGIFTTLHGEDGKLQIVLYKAENGERIDVTEVSSDQAFFTLCESKSGLWYFFDQTEDKLILYRMNSDFSSKTAIKEFTLSEIPYSLTACAMTIMDDTIYFYTMPDDSSSMVLYRYSVN